jgi:hypothetical protein
MVLPTLAADKTVSLTETQINDSYRVTNPRNRKITEVHVDLQPGQAVITATFTAPNTKPIPVSVTLVPSLSNGRVYWTVSAATANGQAASSDLLAQINASISSSWRNYWKGKVTGKVTAFTISDDSVTWTKASTK